MDQKAKDEKVGFCKKIYASDDETISFLFSAPSPGKMPQIPDDILAKLAHCGQSISSEIDLGTSIEEIISQDKPIAE